MPRSGSKVTLRLLRDDGAVVYLNGVEVSRHNMPAGPIDNQTLATLTVNAPDESTFFEQPISPSLLVSGPNTIAVEIHQVNVTSSDISFDLELVGTPSLNPTPPAILTQPQSQTVTVGSDVTFSVEANGTEPLRYRWRRDGITIPGATNSTLTLFDVGTNSAGNYSVIVTNIAGARISSNAVLTVIENDLPTVTLLGPTNGQVSPRQAIFLAAQASDPDGIVSFVDFFANTTRVARVPNFGGTAFNSVWSNAPAGNHEIRAVATDNHGAQASSVPASITVLSNRSHRDRPIGHGAGRLQRCHHFERQRSGRRRPDLHGAHSARPRNAQRLRAVPHLHAAPGFFGPDSFTFSVSDLQFESAPATVDITVTPVNDAPVARAQIENTVTFLDQPTIITLDSKCRRHSGWFAIFGCRQ